MCDDAKNDAHGFMLCQSQTKLCKYLSAEKGKSQIHVVDSRYSSNTYE